MAKVKNAGRHPRAVDSQSGGLNRQCGRLVHESSEQDAICGKYGRGKAVRCARVVVAPSILRLTEMKDVMENASNLRRCLLVFPARQRWEADLTLRFITRHPRGKRPLQTLFRCGQGTERDARLEDVMDMPGGNLLSGAELDRSKAGKDKIVNDAREEKGFF
ncbi:hypothetical protein P154DRAFT_142862 [Amniculicola lignicola CBS 123094]|uniref:Uncharacterized protein n=1 Tax=Amniculicola lignicola CBS 123094 TaxID=1392246 RepID=A0A6A5WMX0_9PLEO|nr:hypothetical protein P154DRAFT_142862 [Amniculicola lignicola CBS 123094]